MGTRSDIQYRGTMHWDHSYHHSDGRKSPLEHSMDYEDALKRISLLPPSERKSAFKAWKKGYVK